MSITNARIIIDGLFNQNLKRDEFLLNSNGTWSNNTSYNLANANDLADVAFTGSYNDLSDKPTIPTVNNATLTIQKNGSNVQTFTANQSTNATANITVPTKTSDLTNDSGFVSLTMSTTDIGEGATLANNTLYGVYE